MPARRGAWLAGRKYLAGSRTCSTRATKRRSAFRRPDAAPRSACALLQAADVSFGYRDELVVRDVSLEVADDGFVGIIGPNGSGKTTLLRLLAGTRTPNRGTITLDGAALASVPRAAIARRMAVVPQETQLAFEYSVLEV